MAMNTVNSFRGYVAAFAILGLAVMPLQAAPIRCSQAKAPDERAICTHPDLL